MILPLASAIVAWSGGGTNFPSNRKVTLCLPPALVQRLPVHRSLLGHKEEMLLTCLDYLECNPSNMYCVCLCNTLVSHYMCCCYTIFTYVFSSTGRLCARIMRVLFFCQVQQRSDIGLVTTTCGVSCLFRGDKTVNSRLHEIPRIGLRMTGRTPTPLFLLYIRETGAIMGSDVGTVRSRASWTLSH